MRESLNNATNTAKNAVQPSTTITGSANKVQYDQNITERKYLHIASKCDYSFFPISPEDEHTVHIEIKPKLQYRNFDWFQTSKRKSKTFLVNSGHRTNNRETVKQI